MPIENRIMFMMRKTLTNIIKETTPAPGMIHPLSDSCITDIKDCLTFIAARERELQEDMGNMADERPYYVDEARTTAEVSLDSIGKQKK